MLTFYKKSIVTTALAALTIVLLLTGCSSQNGAATANVFSAVSAEITSQSPAVSPNAAVSTAAASSDILTYYIGLIGLSKNQIISKMNEEPITVDEGGFEFTKAGIRVWFDQDGNKSVSQVFTANKDINLNGAKIGDQINVFKEKFGAPVSDKNGDMHFKYKDVYLSVNYDVSSGETFAVYILSKDF